MGLAKFTKNETTPFLNEKLTKYGFYTLLYLGRLNIPLCYISSSSMKYYIKSTTYFGTKNRTNWLVILCFKKPQLPTFQKYHNAKNVNRIFYEKLHKEKCLQKGTDYKCNSWKNNEKSISSKVHNLWNNETSIYCDYQFFGTAYFGNGKSIFKL